MKLKNYLFKLTVIAILIIVIVSLVLVGCSSSDSNESKEASKQQEVEPGIQNQISEDSLPSDIQSNTASTVSVEVETVEKGTLITYVQVVGEARPYREVDLIPSLQEEVEKINIQIGEYVEKGDILIELDKEDKEITLKQVKASLAAAEANLQEALNGTREEEIKQLEAELSKAKSNLEIAQKNYERYRELYEKEFISQQTFEDYVNQLTSAKSNYESAKQSLKIAESGSTAETIKNLRAQVTQAEANLSSAKLNLSRTSVKAPISGIISDLNIEIGEITGTNSSIVTISQLDKIKIETYISQGNVNKINSGDTVKVYFSAMDSSFEGIIKSISPVADDDKKSFPVEIVVENPEQIIKAGMYAEVKLKTSQISDEIVIPQEAILEEDGGTYVYVVSDDLVKKTKVETGQSSEDQVIVKNGINTGEKIVVIGEEYLEDGSEVNVVGEGDK